MSNQNKNLWFHLMKTYEFIKYITMTVYCMREEIINKEILEKRNCEIKNMSSKLKNVY
jgi:hypothetical protein